ncbi:MAG TPA: C40 family peptidase [Gemmatimonadaceae bacterium]|nr:C40 family peptidase [Gemmatimonadaceae bacterium]
MPPFRLATIAAAFVAVSAVPAGAQMDTFGRTPIRAPLEALAERGANPRGPFARLNVPQRDSIIGHTRDLLGVRYKWAGINPAKGLDCSGMVKYVFAKLGIELPHRAAELAKLGGAVTKDTADMQPGDLLVFGKGKRISHVGIYVGEGMMIQASSSSRRVVQTPVVKYRPPGSLQWKGVRRVIALDTAVVEGEPQVQPPR